MAFLQERATPCASPVALDTGAARSLSRGFQEALHGTVDP